MPTREGTPPEVPMPDASTVVDAPPDTTVQEGTPASTSAFGNFYDLSFVPPEHWPKIGPDPHEGEVPSGEITISTMLYGLDFKAKLFMEKYPQAKIHIVDLSEGSTIFDAEKYRAQISTQLMSGEGPDVINVSIMNFPLIANKGFFVDLYEYIDKDEYIPRETFYQGILSALETDGKLYQIATNIIYYQYRVRKEYMQYLSEETLNKKILTYRDRIQMYEELAPHLSGDDKMDSGFYASRLYEEVAHQYVDYQNRTATFTDGFPDVLREVLPWLQTDLENITDNDIMEADVTVGIGKQIPYEDRPYRGLWLQGSTDGEIPFHSSDTFAINQNSSNKELAWAFIRYMLTDFSEPLYFYGIPVNRNMFYKMASDPGYVGYLASHGTVSEPIEKLYVEIIEGMDAHSISVSALMDVSNIEYDLVMEVVGEVVAGRLTPEEAAQRMEERINIMLNE